MTSTIYQCCSLLSLTLPDKLFWPGNPAYATSLSSYYSAQEAAVQPACIVLPQTAQDVSVAVRILTGQASGNGSRDSASALQRCPFATRSGGHAVFPGAANLEAGVTIDLSALSCITVSTPGVGVAAAPIVTVGAGAKWGAVYAELDPRQLGVGGGRAGDVGVGGLTLGGGISYFGPRDGWVCDTVLDFEVVLANGSIVHANQDENADLLWALRGGTNNLGIVTGVSLQAFAQGDLWGGWTTSTFETADAHIVATAAFNEPEGLDESASLITTFAYSGAQDAFVVVTNMQYTKPEADPPVFNNFTMLTSLSSTQRITNMTDLAAETDANTPRGLRQAEATLTIAPSVAAINATVRAWKSSVASVRSMDNVTWAVGIDSLPPQLYSRYAGGSHNALGLTERNGSSLLVLHLTMSWTNAIDDATAHRTIRDLVATIQRDVGNLGAVDSFQYVNYAAPWQQPIKSYGISSVGRLQQVREMYDPTHVFTDLVPGGFKIPL
ncbi:oxidoreductase- FAD-binding [Apiospora sp. TS-2023a]